MTTQAAELLGVKTAEIRPFEERDPFNPHLTVSGWICLKVDHRYGSLVLHKINGNDIGLRVVYATPKFHYPFSQAENGDRNFHWPRFKQGRIYEKLDGTNILVYAYEYEGQVCRTAKTRLTPFLRQGQYGDFLALFREAPHYATALASASPSCSVAYELYGYRNPVLIRYPFPLHLTELYRVSQTDGALSPPCSELAGPVVETVDATTNLTLLYGELRRQAQNANKVKDEEISGLEGYMIYLQDEYSKWSVWKLKPEMIEEIAWANSMISKHSILTTTWNALEEVPIDRLDVAVVKRLLLEEYTKQQIEQSKYRIEKSVADVKATAHFLNAVAFAYGALPPEVKQAGKAAVMRALAKYYDRGTMSSVFTALKRQGLLE